MDTFFSTHPKRIAVAVSGGGDSVGLALLLRRWCWQRNVHLIALIVDHGLRSDSAQEARYVKTILEKLSIETYVLHNRSPAPIKNIQSYARTVRYTLLKAWCMEHCVHDLCLAHHAGDSLETTALRQASGSGAVGLAGMSRVCYCDFGRIIRPVLSFKKHDLIAVCKQENVVFVRDPSNADKRYLRVLMRRALQEKAFKGTIQSLRRASIKARAAVEETLTSDLVSCTHPFLAGYVVVKSCALGLPHVRLFMLLRQCLMWVSGTVLPPRSKKLLSLCEALQGHFKGATLHGCRIKILQKRIYIFREYKAMGNPVCGRAIFDNRFVLARSYQSNPAYTLGALGVRARALLQQRDISVKGAPCPKTILPVVPAVFYGDRVDFISGISLERSSECAIMGRVQNIFAPAPFCP